MYLLCHLRWSNVRFAYSPQLIKHAGKLNGGLACENTRMQTIK